MAKKILITSALPYVNNVPHLGNIIGCVLSADVFARYSRSRGNDTLFICGTDEHGTATETKALEEGLTPEQICDKYYKIHKEIYEWFGCSFDAFGRTSTDTHTEVVQSIFKRVNENGLILKDVLEQPWCPKCDKFLADRFVEGTCPHCGHDGARGDQCQSCDKLLNAIDLIGPKCKTCNTKAQIKKTNHLFLDLPKLEPELKKWADASSESGNWSENSKHITKAWFKEGLKQRCVSRDLKWGIPIPMEGYEDKVFYVWFDAPIGYISITKHAFPDDWQSWWQSDQVKLYQFMAKDNIPFHTLIFPATLLATKDKWTMLHHINSTEYLNYEGGKFSKTDKTGVFGDDAKSTGIPPDVCRYYLLSNRPEGSDTYFNWKDFQDKNNNELLANLGNFVNRTLTFTKRYFDGKVPGAHLTDPDDKLIQDVSEQMAKVIDLLDNVKERDALKEILNISRLGNQYFQENAPWTLVKEDSTPEQKERCGTVMNLCCNLVRTLATFIEPFLPFTSKEIFAQLGMETDLKLEYKMSLDIKPGHPIGEPKPLYKKLEDKEIKQWREKFGGEKKSDKKKELQIFEKFPADLRVAKVLEVNDHPDAGKLYVLKVDLGSEQRQIVAGLKAHIPRENLIDRHIIVVCNLKPAELRGVQSQGMLLAAEKKNKIAVLEAPESDPGDEVNLKGVPNEEPFKELDVTEFFKLSLKVDEEEHIVVENFKKRLKAPTEYIIAKGMKPGAKVR